MTTSTRDVLWLFFILIVVGVIWSGRGRDFNLVPRSGPRLSPFESSKTTSNERGSIFGNTEQFEQKNENENVSITKIPALQITISAQTVQNTDPQKEYITIRNEGEYDINLDGAKIKNKDNVEAKIENDENGRPIVLKPNETAYILTGKSTRGVNFKVNKCSGYFNQFYDFTPTLYTTCPSISSLSEVDKLDDACLEYLPEIRSCEMRTSLPTDLSGNCQNFIQQHSSYQGCVSDHKNDDNFDEREWRIFLNRTAEFWAKRNETIKLIDKTGKVIAEASY